MRSGLRIAVVLAAGVAAYSNVSSVPLLYDDGPALAENESIRKLSLASLTPPAETTLAGRPLANLTFALNYAAAGLALPPLHWTNVAIHLMAALVLMALVRRTLLLTGRFEQSADAFALVAALLWMLHPVQTESVTYVVQRVESLAGLFLLLMLYAGVRASTAARPFAWSAAAVLACGLGMACKETMAVAPLILVLYDRAFLFGSFKEAASRRGGLYAGLGATLGILALQLATNPRPTSAGFRFPELSPLRYLGIQVRAIVHYLRLLVWPAGMVFDYGDAGISVQLAKSIADWGPQAALLAVLVGLALWAWSRHPAIGFLGTSFFILLAPSSSIIAIPAEPISEHRLYLPSAAALILLVFGARAIPARRVLAGGAIVVLGLLTWQRNQVYRSAISLWEDTVSKRPANPRAWSALGQAYADDGQMARARTALETALAKDPLSVTALRRFGFLEEKAGRLDAAAGYYRRSLAREARQPDVHLNLAHTLEAQGRPAEALEHYLAAGRLKPADAEIRGDAANCFAKLGRPDEAVASWSAALALKPDWALGHYNLGVVLARVRRYDAALEEFHRASRLDPKLAAAWHRGGLVASWLGRPEAVQDLQTAVALEPRLEPMEDLAWLLATHPEPSVRDGERALIWARRADALAKGQVRSLDVLAAALAEAGHFDEARQTEARAVEAAQGGDVESLRGRLALYASKKPYREKPEPAR
jgi:tetratricopeptide (TPR) repeat protein